MTLMTENLHRHIDSESINLATDANQRAKTISLAVISGNHSRYVLIRNQRIVGHEYDCLSLFFSPIQVLP